MEKIKIKQLICRALQLEEGMITNIRRTPGGLTNVSYFATINDEQYVVRFAGKGTEELINRHAERSNLQFGTKLGINPAFIYFNVTTGMKITHKIKGAITLTPTLHREEHTVKQMITLFQRLHHSNKSMKNDFKLFDLQIHYKKIAKDVNPFLNEMFAPLEGKVMKLKGVYESLQITKTPCHIDSVCSNIIKSADDELYLIDWEYSGMFDPFWDLATLFLSFECDADEELYFLTHYLGRGPDREELQRILMHKIFQDYLWFLWAVYKEAKGDFHRSDGVDRLKRATNNIVRYELLFKEDIVV